MDTSDFWGFELQPIYPIPAVASNEHSMALVFHSQRLSANDSETRSMASQHFRQLSVAQPLQLHSQSNCRQLWRSKVVLSLMHLTYAASLCKIWRYRNEVCSLRMDDDFPSPVFLWLQHLLSISLQHLWKKRLILDFNRWSKALNSQWQNLEQISELPQKLVL